MQPVGVRVTIREGDELLLKKRTLTNLYNERPMWLANAHRDLDAAVAAAYGWQPDLSDDDILSRLLTLNQSRAHSQSLPCANADQSKQEALAQLDRSRETKI